MRVEIPFLTLCLSTTAYAAFIAPPKISLSSRPSRSSGAGRRAVSPVNVQLSDAFNGTDLQWFGNISVGTPPQMIPVIFDTGSSAIEITSTLCDNCGSELLFDPSASSTFVLENGTGELDFGTCLGVRPVTDAEPCVLAVQEGTDTISIGDLSTTNITLTLITNETVTFSDFPWFSGIVGLSSTSSGQGTSLFGRFVEQGLEALFSTYLSPIDVGNAELTLGGIDDTKFTGELVYTPILDESHWTITSTHIFVNGQTVDILSQNLTQIADSGTSNMLLPTNITEAIYALISPEIKPFAPLPSTYGVPCSLIPTLNATISYTFLSTEGTPFNLTIPTSELSVGPFKEAPDTCQTLINAVDDFSIVGASLLKHWYTVWDSGNQRMGFAPAVGAQA